MTQIIIFDILLPMPNISEKIANKTTVVIEKKVNETMEKPIWIAQQFLDLFKNIRDKSIPLKYKIYWLVGGLIIWGLYILMPFDLIPEFLLSIFGLVEDALFPVFIIWQFNRWAQKYRQTPRLLAK